MMFRGELLKFVDNAAPGTRIALFVNARQDDRTGALEVTLPLKQESLRTALNPAKMSESN